LQGEDVCARVLHAEPLDDTAAKTQKGLRIFVAHQIAGIDRQAAAAGGGGRSAQGHAGAAAFDRKLADPVLCIFLINVVN
jgi:DNA polymerase-3 subunit alpha